MFGKKCTLCTVSSDCYAQLHNVHCLQCTIVMIQLLEL